MRLPACGSSSLQSLSMFFFLCELLGERVDVEICRVSEMEGVTLVNELFGCIREVGNEIGDIAMWDVFPGSGEDDAADLDLTDNTGGGKLKLNECLLCFSGERVPVRLTEIGEGDTGGNGRI